MELGGRLSPEPGWSDQRVESLGHQLGLPPWVTAASRVSLLGHACDLATAMPSWHRVLVESQKDRLAGIC